MQETNLRYQQCEIDLIKELLYTMQRTEIVKELQAYQEKHGLFIRSYKSITTKIRQLGFHPNLREDNFNKHQLAKILNINPCRVTYWCEKGLKFTSIENAKRNSIIRKEDFTEWARTHTHLLKGFDRDALLRVIDDVELADEISEMRPYSCRVFNITLNKSYRNLEEAARAVYTCSSGLSTALKRGGKCAGYEWKYEVPA
jgi:hypothetical protein